MRAISRTITVLISVYLAAGSLTLAAKTPVEGTASGLPEYVSSVAMSPAEYGFSDELMSYVADPMLQAEPVDDAKVVVIPTWESIEQDPDLIETTTRDLNIMCRIFDKELGLSGQAGPARIPLLGDVPVLGDAMWANMYASHQRQRFPTFFGEKARETRGIYLEGYGVVFFVKVGLPLTPPPQVEEPAKQTETDVDPVWRLTEQEIYEPEKLRKKKAVSAAAKYDETRVEDLKRKLVRTLKHSANIRSLKPDEQIIVTVRGPQLVLGPAKVLSIRAKKSDVEAFAKGQLNLDQFREKVQILLYADYSVTTFSLDASSALDVSRSRTRSRY